MGFLQSKGTVKVLREWFGPDLALQPRKSTIIQHVYLPLCQGSNILLWILIDHIQFLWFLKNPIKITKNKIRQTESIIYIFYFP